jgi:hypothetical protein
MDNNNLLARNFRTSASVITPVILAACLVCKWPAHMIGLALLACFVISSPSTLALHLFLWLSQRLRFQTGFTWMLLLAAIPIGSLVVAELFAAWVPGRTWIILALVAVSSYLALITNSLAISQIFNSTDHEREENNSID